MEQRQQIDDRASGRKLKGSKMHSERKHTIEQKEKIRELDWLANEDGIDERIGKSKSLMYPRQQAINHPLYDRLLKYTTVGCPANCGTDWTEEHIISAIRHGPHSSTMKIPTLKALHVEVQEKIKQGYARIVSFGELRKHVPKNLKIQRVAMIPYKSRDYRTILDLFFKLRINRTIMPSVNQSTVQVAPQYSMCVFFHCAFLNP